MRKIRLTKEERAIEDSIEEFVPVGKNEFNEIVRSLASRRKDAVLNIRINHNDLAQLKRKAEKLGVRYQTFISELLHRIAHN